MPIVRLSRDKRGLDTLYLIDTRPDGPRSGGARVLYFWTAPAGLRVGRDALDESRQRELEEAHPDIAFDWPELMKAVDAARQQAAAVLTPEARREAWRGAGRPAKPAHRQSARGDAGSVEAASANPPPLSEPFRESAFVPDELPVAAPAPTVAGDDASKNADSSTPKARRRRRRPRRAGDSHETPQTADPIIDS